MHLAIDTNIPAEDAIAMLALAPRASEETATSARRLFGPGSPDHGNHTGGFAPWAEIADEVNALAARGNSGFRIPKIA